MNRETKLLLSSVVISLLIATLIFAILVALAPTSTPFAVNNYGWNGLEQVNSKYSLHEISSISEAASSRKSVLLEISPTIQFSASESQMVRSFITGGGTLLILDSSGISNSLLKGIGADISVAGNLVYDPVYNWKQESLPFAYISGNQSITKGVQGLALSSASSLLVGQSSNAKIIAQSGPQSLALNSSNGLIIGRGPFIMAALEYIGSGELVVIGDSTFLMNSVSGVADNQILLNNLLSNSTVYLDTSSWPVNSQTTVKANLLSLYSILSSMPYRYLSVLAFIGVALLGFNVYTKVSSLRNATPGGDQGKVAKVTFNSTTLERVRKEREKYGARGAD